MNKVVAHCHDGYVMKGITNDFLPTKDRFHLVLAGSQPGTKPLEVPFSTLKAIFFVHDLEGKPEYRKSNAFDPDRLQASKKIRIVFKDGEVMVGTTNGYQPGRPGFFVVPVDQGSNNERCFVVSAATKEITLF
ncbi:MAG: hypothetical protein Q8O00_15550 [Holophaga sp.]|nr:hypothetical protein [Holophaga sp.]